jgi:hypothetical protein
MTVMLSFVPQTIRATLHLFFPSALALAAVYAIYGWSHLRRHARVKTRSEESRSPPRRGRTLERGLELNTGVKRDIKEKPEVEEASPFPDLVNLEVSEADKCQVKEDKKLYHMLQNIEDYPGEQPVMSDGRLLT